MREGDIFSWLWRPELGRHNYAPFGDYHCYSRIAVFRNGTLVDTYWGENGGATRLDPAND